MKKIMNKQAGFTLIELVVVIVILGILAATAAPKFIDLTSDARGSVIEAVRGSINSATDLAHSKALIKGKTQAGDAISVAGSSITLVTGGWPDNASIGLLLDLDGDISATAGTATTAAKFVHADATDSATCIVTYDASSASSEVRPAIPAATTSGC